MSVSVDTIRQATIGTGTIEGHVLYALPEFLRRVGWSRHALREARKRGLRVRYAARNGFILGRDFLEYLDQHGRDQK